MDNKHPVESHAVDAATHSPACHHDHDHHDQGPSLDPTALKGLVLQVPDMDCAAEEAQIRQALQDLPDVRGLQFDLGARVLAVDASESSWQTVIERLKSAGFESRRLQDQAQLSQ